MAEIKCPNCGTLISLEQSDLDSVVQQVRDEQFRLELDERMRQADVEREQAVKLAEEQAKTRLATRESQLDATIAELRAQLESQAEAFDAREKLAEEQAKTRLATRESQLDATIAELRAQLESQAEAYDAREKLAVTRAASEAETRIQALESQVREKDAQMKAQKEQLETQHRLAVAQEAAKAQKERDQLQAALALKDSERELAVNQAVSQVEKERDELVAAVKLSKTEREASEARLREQMAEQQRHHEEALSFQREEIERLKDMKARLSTKMVGESLEQHCQYEFDRIRSVAFPNAYFEKDNDVSQGTKGDFIFREEDEDGNEVISIMFEMKNEAETNSVKKKNEDHFAKLDKDRTKKGCEYAILVSLLEPESELYNEGIVDVSHRYPKMYVIRPQFFIPIISLLRNAAQSSLAYKRELALVRQQDLDITNFERDLDLFKEGFFRNFQLASDRFENAITGIDRTIEQLQKIRENLLKSERHLSAANKKLEGLTVKKLTRKNPTMKAKFEALKEGPEEAAGSEPAEAVESDLISEPEHDETAGSEPERA